MVRVIWREWFNEETIKKLEAMGTLPHNETVLDAWDTRTGEDAARAIAVEANRIDPEAFHESGEVITILEPKEIAGNYEIYVEYIPSFTAYRFDEK